MPDTITPKLGLTKPEVGGSPNTWGNKLNTNFDILDQKGVFNTSQWTMTLGDGNPASSTGPFFITRYNNAGVAQGNPFTIDRQTGDITIAQKLTAVGDATFSGKIIVTGNIEGSAAILTGAISAGTTMTANQFLASAATAAYTPARYTSTDPGAAAGPIVELFRDSATPVASDLTGQILFTGKNGGAAKVSLASITSTILDATAGSEDANIVVKAMTAGAMTDALTITGAGISVPGVLIGGVPVNPLPTLPTFHDLLTGTLATFNVPAGARQLRGRMVGAGAGGNGIGGTAGNGQPGGATTFGTITANGGGAGSAANPGAGGTGGAGSARLRINGGGGETGDNVTSATGGGKGGGCGGVSAFGGAARGPGPGAATLPGIAAAPNSGSGGSGASNGGSGGGGGGSGEYVEFVINAPAASYTYSVGVGGAGGTAGSGQAGGAGGSGLITIEVIY